VGKLPYDGDRGLEVSVTLQLKTQYTLAVLKFDLDRDKGSPHVLVTSRDGFDAPVCQAVGSSDIIATLIPKFVCYTLAYWVFVIRVSSSRHHAVELQGKSSWRDRARLISALLPIAAAQRNSTKPPGILAITYQHSPPS